MKILSKGQIFAIIGAVALFCLTLALPKTVPFQAKAVENLFPEGEQDVEMQIKNGILSVLNDETPMQGIMAIRGVLEKDTENLKARLALGVFSAISGQSDNALKHFQLAGKSKSDVDAAAKFLAEIYAKDGKSSMIAGQLSQYITKGDDPKVIDIVEKIINKLKTFKNKL